MKRNITSYSNILGILKPVAYYSRISISFLGQVASHSKLASFPDIAKATQGTFFLVLLELIKETVWESKENTLIAWNHFLEPNR